MMINNLNSTNNNTKMVIKNFFRNKMNNNLVNLILIFLILKANNKFHIKQCHLAHHLKINNKKNIKVILKHLCNSLEFNTKIHLILQLKINNKKMIMMMISLKISRR